MTLCCAVIAPAILCACAPKPDASPAGTASPPPGHAPPGMVWVPGGEFEMGSEGPHASAFEGPVHRVRVDGFFMDVHTVTNAEFRAFLKATGYGTVAERAPNAE